MDIDNFYHSTQWKKLRAEHLKKSPYCMNSVSLGLQEPGEQVHHIIRFQSQYDPELAMELAMDPDNLVTVTNRVHRDIHSKKPKFLSPYFQKYLYDMKQYLTQKYYNEGKLIAWTNDWNKRKH